MSLDLDDNFHIWKIKLQLAQQGNYQALEDIKLQSTARNSEYSFIENNINDALKNAQIKFIKENTTYGSFEIYNQVPIFLVLEGEIQVKCLNLEGDQQTIAKILQRGVVWISKDKIVSKFGESNLNIVTKFQLSCSKKSIVIEINDQSRRKIQNGDKSPTSLVGLREQSIMKKYMLFPLKYIRIQDYDIKTFKSEQKFYLLEGKACYYLQKGKERTLLTVYEEGYINPKQFEATPEISLYIFQNSKILIFQEQFMRDDVVAGLQSKRNQHIQALVKGYQKMPVQEKKKVQLKLINIYKLNKKELDRTVYGIVEVPVAPAKEQVKRISTKNDLISTSSSIKEKCKIRISKKKKIN